MIFFSFVKYISTHLKKQERNLSLVVSDCTCMLLKVTPYSCGIPKAGVMGEVCIMTHEWPGPRSQVPNMVRTQPVQNDSL